VTKATPGVTVGFPSPMYFRFRNIINQFIDLKYFVIERARESKEFLKALYIYTVQAVCR